MTTNPYQPTPLDRPPMARPTEPSKVILWCLVYNGCMAVLYLAVVLISIGMILLSDYMAEDDPTVDPRQFIVMGSVMLPLSLVLLVAFLLPFFWRQRGNAFWIYQLVLIVLGTTSCATWPATIPLLIYWIKDRERIIQT